MFWKTFLIFLGDCGTCLEEFASKQGCECMEDDACDVAAAIPDGCHHCGAEAEKFCEDYMKEKEPEKSKTYGFMSKIWTMNVFVSHDIVKDTPLKDTTRFKTRIIKIYILYHLIRWILLSFLEEMYRYFGHIFIICPSFYIISWKFYNFYFLFVA